jgi:hypothetical protein
LLKVRLANERFVWIVGSDHSTMEISFYVLDLLGLTEPRRGCPLHVWATHGSVASAANTLAKSQRAAVSFDARDPRLGTTSDDHGFEWQKRERVEGLPGFATARLIDGKKISIRLRCSK